MSTASPEQSLHALYSDHHGWLHDWLRKRLGNHADAADLAHDTFLRVLLRRDGVSVREPRSYLSTIARGLVVDFFRRRDLERAYLDVLATLPEPLLPSLETRAILLEALVAIAAMLDGLKPAVRQAFILSQIEGLTYDEIAIRLGVTKRTVANYMATALEQCFLLAP